MPKVSVIIPAHNSFQYLSEAVQSVLDQTFKDVEIIVIDDGSTDATADVARSFGEAVTYVRQENSGAASARNHGIRLARGRFVAFLDADDTWLPEKLRKQVELFGRRPELDMVFTENYLFDDDGIYCDSLDKKERLMHGDLASNIFMLSGVATPTVMVRREVFDRLGVFEERLAQAEDDNLWVRITSHCKAELIDEPLVKIREHTDRISHDRAKLFDSILQSIELLRTEYGEVVSRKVEPLLPTKLAQVYSHRGYAFFDAEDFPKARKSLWRAIKVKPLAYRPWAFLILTFCPSSFRSWLKRVRKVLKPASYQPPKWIRQEKVEE